MATIRRRVLYWSVCSVISYDEASDTIKAHLLQAIKTRAKDDTRKTYWIYSEEENVDTFEKKHVLANMDFLFLSLLHQSLILH